MKKLLVFLLSFSTSYLANAQNKETLAIVKEGKVLYRSEMASWYGTDVFLEKYKDRAKIGGYFSYPYNNIYKCVFFSKGDKPKIIGTISFDSTYVVQSAVTDLTEREFSQVETDFYMLRKLSLARVNSDTAFKKFNNTELNIIPIIDKKIRKVYVLTSPKLTGTVILGNDYLINFNKDNQIVDVKKLHKNLIPINFSKTDSTKIAMHTHASETGDFITATDICTLMLYGKFTNWTQHYVMSAKNVSIWDVKKNELLILTREAWEKISKHQEEKNMSNN